MLHVICCADGFIVFCSRCGFASSNVLIKCSVFVQFALTFQMVLTCSVCFVSSLLIKVCLCGLQKGVGEKAVNQLDKTVSSKLEATVARQIQLQFQTSGKQALQVSSSLISSHIFVKYP